MRRIIWCFLSIFCCTVLDIEAQRRIKVWGAEFFPLLMKHWVSMVRMCCFGKRYMRKRYGALQCWVIDRFLTTVIGAVHRITTLTTDTVVQTAIKFWVDHAQRY